MKKDVLFMCQFFYPEYITSAVLPYETAIDLAEKGYKVGALCGYPHDYYIEKDIPSREVVNNVTIERLHYPDFNKNKFYGRLLNYFAYTSTVLLNVRKIKEYKTVIVYSNPPVLPIVTAIANILYKTKVIFVSYDIYPEIAIETKIIDKNSVISKMMNFINKKVFKRLTRVIALSNEMKKYISENREISLEKIEVIPNWANETSINTKEAVDNPLFSELANTDTTVISYFGNMGTAQDIDTIIDAIRSLKENKNIFFLFAGHGNKMDLLRETVQNENLKNVRIFDFLHGKDYQDALAISDSFIVSLVEGITGLCVPSKTYSYMSAGKPILSLMDLNCDINDDLVQYQAGFPIENGDTHTLVKSIEKLQDSEVVNSMGENCKRLFNEKYTRETNTDKYAKLLKNVLEEL